MKPFFSNKRYFCRTLCIIICMTMLLSVFSSCKSKPNKEDGFSFNGSAYMTDGVTDLPEALSEVSITATGSPSCIIPTDATFKIKTSGKTDVETLSGYISVTPEVNFTVSAKSGTEFLLTPLPGSLEKGRVYRFMVGDPENPVYSFAFQTESELVVRSVLPADLATGVPLDTGIEIAFTEVVRNVKPEKYITVSPETAGRFEFYPDGKTVVFVPEENLSENTVYTVRVKSGMKSESGKRLEADFESKFRTGVTVAAQNKSTITINQNTGKTIFATGEYPTFYYDVYYYYFLNNVEPQHNDVSVMLYRYSDAKEAIEAMKAYEAVRGDYFQTGGSYIFPTQGLTKAGEYKITPAVKSRYNSDYVRQMYFSLPQTGAGIYLINYTVSGTWRTEFEKTFQLIFQVTDLRVHTQSCDGGTLFWVNNLSGTPAAGASIEADCFNRIESWNTEGGRAAYTNVSGTTDADGLCLIRNGERSAAYVKVSAGGDETIVTLRCAEDIVQKYYCKYIYTDRAVYFKNDTVNYWGVITPGGEETLPARLYVYVGSIPYGSVAVAPDGSFSGSLPIEDYAGSGYYIRFCRDDATLVTKKYIRVTQEDKPVYRGTVAFDKLFYEYGDTITATLTASFFDGTPAPGLQFSVKVRISAPQSTSQKFEVLTEADGTAKITLNNTRFTSDSRTYPITVYIDAKLIGFETTRLRMYNSVLYFHSDVQLRAVRKSADYSEAYLNKTDTSRIKTAADLNNLSNLIYGEPAGGSATISLVKREFYRASQGTEYDPITKTTYHRYTTKTRDTTIKTYKEDFKNGIIRLEHYEVSGFEGYYFYTVEYYNAKNNTTFSVSINAVKSASARGNDFPISWYNYNLGRNDSAYSVGEHVIISYQYDKQPVTGRVLFTVYDSKGLVQKRIVNEGKIAFTFTEDMVLFCRVYAVTLDAGEYRVQSITPTYDYASDNTLNIEILPDKNIYKPGERATVIIKVSDKNRQPVSGTVLLSVVDEACFALGREQYLSPVEDYFSPTINGNFYTPYYYSVISSYEYFYQSSSPIVTVWVDSRLNIFNEAGLSGGIRSAAGSMDSPAEAEMAYYASEPEVYIREVFLDNPVFNAVSIGADGIAALSFTVPDNITEWRFTALATANIDSPQASRRMLGSATTDVICTLPYFINVSSVSYYLVGDDVTVSARSSGRALVGAGPVRYSAIITDETGKTIKTKQAELKPQDTAWLNFGSLPAGDYSVTVTAFCGEYSDGVKLSFDVRESGNVVDIRRDITVDKIKSIKPLAYPVTLSFYESSCELYLRAVNFIRWNYVISRSDAQAAYYVALSASEALFGSNRTDGLAEIRERLSANRGGLVSLLDYSEGDISLTSKICAIAPEALTEQLKASIIGVLQAYLGGGEYLDDTELCAALLGLAALGEPVLDVLYNVASVAAAYSVEAKLYLAAAFAYIGDFPAAKVIYAAVKSEYLSENEAKELYIRGEGTEEQIKLTALALVVASRLNRTDAEGMVKYLLGHVSGAEYYELEMAAYVRFFMPTERVESTFSYRFAGGEVQTITLRAGGAYALTLTRHGFETLEIVGADPNIRVRAAYFGSPADALEGREQTETISVQKTITPYDEKLGLYLVTLNFSGKTDRAHLCFSISDSIPTGARFVSSVVFDKPYTTLRSRTSAWLYNTGGQQMRGGISIWTPNSKWNDKFDEYTYSGSVSYLIRGAVIGDFIVEEALIRSNLTGSYATTERMKVTIKEDKWVIKQ